MKKIKLFRKNDLWHSDQWPKLFNILRDSFWWQGPFKKGAYCWNEPYICRSVEITENLYIILLILIFKQANKEGIYDHFVKKNLYFYLIFVIWIIFWRRLVSFTCGGPKRSWQFCSLTFSFFLSFTCIAFTNFVFVFVHNYMEY